MTPPAPKAHQPGECEGMASRLAALEHAAGDRASHGALQALRAHLDACPACRDRHAGRVARIEGVCALRARAVPDGALEGLRQRVMAGVASGTHAGMSEAFLDAPQALARWRAVAVAASLLLVTGAGLLASGALDRASTRPERDLRDTLLPPLARPWTPSAAPQRPGDDLLQPVLMPGQGVRGFYLQPARPGRAPALAPAESGD